MKLRPYRMLKDMGKALDWIDKMTKTNKSQVYKIKYGPTLYQLTCVHPDAVRTVLRNGMGMGNGEWELDCLIDV